MTWTTIKDRLREVKQSDSRMNEELFAAAYGWSYPLFGAARAEYDSLTRETGRTDYTGDIGSAMALVDRVLDNVTYDFLIVRDKSAVIGLQFHGTEDRPKVNSTRTKAVNAQIGILVCLAELEAAHVTKQAA